MPTGHGVETIGAIATPLGSGGVGIIRLSGPKSLAIGQRLFVSAREGFSGCKPYRLHHGWIHDPAGNVLDEVLVSYMPGPGSYTGEDVLEINCHGGPAVVQAVLQAVVDCGARLARAGEFTLRAYQNGRLDLTQAEAVAEMVNAPTQSSLRLAGSKLAGNLGHYVRNLRHRLEDLRVQLCVAVDFPEEEIECLSPEALQRGVHDVLSDIERIVANYERDRYWRDGALVVLAGRVNAGKSSLLNAILGRERAIVTPIAGTTRDYLEEQVNLQGVPVRLVDTAGLRPTADAIEQAGLDRSRALLEQADVVCLVVDGSEQLAPEDQELLDTVPAANMMLILNKQDLPPCAPTREYLQQLGVRTVPVVAVEGTGVEAVVHELRRCLVGERREPDQGELVPNLRQCQGLRQAQDELRALQQECQENLPYDLLGVRLETACTVLSEIIGDISPAEVLDHVFGDFCIGK